VVSQLGARTIVARDDARDGGSGLDRPRGAQDDGVADTGLAVAELDSSLSHACRGGGLTDPRQRPDVVAAKPAEQKLAELVRSVDVQDERPRRTRLVVLVRVGHDRPGARQVHTLRLTLVDPPAQRAETGAVRR